MRAIILAAGRGSRMGAETAAKPKCFVEVAGRTLLSMQCASLRQAGVTRIGVVTGYRAESFAGTGLEMLNNPRWAETNMVMSLACAASWLRSEPCIVSYADIFYAPATIARLVANTDDIAIAYDPAWYELWRRRFPDPLVDAETFEIDAMGWITTIGGKPSALAEIKGQYMGLLRFSPRGWASVESHLAQLTDQARDRLDMTSLLMQLIKGGQTIRGVPIAESWGEVDNPSDVAVYEAMLRNGELQLPA